MTRILVYSHDTFGLGNIRRMLRISEALVEHDPDCSVLIVTGSPMLHAFRLPPRIDYVKLPCLARDTEGTYGVKHLDMAYSDALRMRAGLILSAASDFSPDVVLVDKKPLGVGGELAPMLELLAQRSRRPAMHLLLRDILDTAAATQRVWQAHDYHGAIERFYDSVLVVGESQVFDLAEAYAFPPSTRAKLHYCGYIDRARPQLAGAVPAAAGQQRVLVHAGGGQDGVALINAAIAALGLLGPERGFACRIIGGPELDPANRARQSATAARLPNVEWIDFTDAMGAEIAAADLVVAMGGYNSVCEILGYRKRAIIVPRSVPVREQRIRAEAMARLGLLAMIPLERLDPHRLAEQIVRELELVNVRPAQTGRLKFDGLGNLCRVLFPNPPAALAVAQRRGDVA